MVKLLRGRGAVLLFVFAFSMTLGGCGKKADPTEAAKHFFSLLAAGEIPKAYAESAFGFQAQQTELAFTHNANQLGLTHQAGIAWQPSQITDKEARIDVEITTADGTKVPFVVVLVDESGVWRVHSLRSPRGPGQPAANRFTLVGKGAAFSDAQSQPLPNEEEIQKLTQTTIRRFDKALQEKSFTEFYQTVATAWQKQLTVGQLERAFAGFINAEVKIGGLSDAEMQLDGPPTIDPQGVLGVNGHYNTVPYRIFYSMKFIREGPWWKLFGLDMHLEK